MPPKAATITINATTLFGLLDALQAATEYVKHIDQAASPGTVAIRVDDVEHARELANTIHGYSRAKPEAGVVVTLDGHQVGRRDHDHQLGVLAGAATIAALDQMPTAGRLTDGGPPRHDVGVRVTSVRGVFGVVQGLVGIASVYGHDSRDRVEGGADLVARFLTIEGAERFERAVKSVATSRPDWGIITIQRRSGE